MDVGPGITAEFPVLTDEQVASVARRGTRHHPTAGEVLDAAGDRDYDVIVIEAGTVDVLRPAMAQRPRDPDRNPGPGPLVADPVGSGAGAPTNTHGAVAAGDLSV